MDNPKIMLLGNTFMLLGVGFIAGSVTLGSYNGLTAAGYILLGVGFLISLYGFFRKKR